MFVLQLYVSSCDRIPRVAHPRLDVGFRERAGRKNTLPPEVEEGVVERREAFRCCRWHLDHLCQLLTPPIVELLHDLLFVVYGCAIEDEQERVLIQRPCSLCKEITDVLQQHGSVDALLPLLR